MRYRHLTVRETSEGRRTRQSRERKVGSSVQKYHRESQAYWPSGPFS